jgi:hypothetical protein
MQTMVVGEKKRFWIPEPLAYGGKPGRPQGMLVFDVELLEIDPAPDAAMPSGHPGVKGMMPKGGATAPSRGAPPAGGAPKDDDKAAAGDSKSGE